MAGLPAYECGQVAGGDEGPCAVDDVLYLVTDVFDDALPGLGDLVLVVVADASHIVGGPVASRTTTGAVPGGRTQVTFWNAMPSCAAAFSAANACVDGFRICQPGVCLPTARSTSSRSERICRAPLVTAIQVPPGMSTRRSSAIADSRLGT